MAVSSNLHCLSGEEMENLRRPLRLSLESQLLVCSLNDGSILIVHLVSVWRPNTEFAVGKLDSWRSTHMVCCMWFGDVGPVVRMTGKHADRSPCKFVCTSTTAPSCLGRDKPLCCGWHPSRNLLEWRCCAPTRRARSHRTSVEASVV